MNLIRTGLYALACFWTLLITALIGNVIYDALGGTPSEVNYCMFTAVFAWIALLVGIAASFVESIPGIVTIVIDALAILFTFIAAVVLSARLGVNSCSNLDYTVNNSLTTGSLNLEKRCRELQASCAFFWFLFATFCAAFAMSFLGGGNRSLGSSRGGIRKGGPSMSQV